MKREIKFKAKRADNGEWVYGYYYEVRGESIIYSEDHSDNADSYYNDEVIPETVCQFINKTDLNDKDVFLEDIFLDEYGDAFQVIQLDCGRYGAKMLSNGYIDEFISWGKVEIIGNIHN